MRGKNLNAVEGMQRQKVRVARDDMGSMAAHREFKEFVVLRVTASVYPYINVNPLSCARQSREKASNILLIQIAAELLSAQDFIEFGKRYEGKQDFSFSDSQFKCVARLGIG